MLEVKIEASYLVLSSTNTKNIIIRTHVAATIMTVPAQ